MDRIIEALVYKYMSPIFYFSLKKTSDRYAAEELTQEILLEAISSLRRGSKPKNIHAWIWKIARNRYARRIVRGDVSVMCVDIDEYTQILSDEKDPSDDVLRDEEYGRLLHNRRPFS